ncbi:MAG: PD40 domain-containing protein [Gemmatimonadetes bacterium]|nr:PD40 domain-containing protein [Gemmatimonadota bacterium]
MRRAPLTLSRVAGAVGCVLLPACASGPETVYTLTPPTWFEDGWSFYDVSADGAWASYGARFGARLIDLKSGREDTTRYASPGALRAAGGPAGLIAWGGEAPSDLTVPEYAVTRLSPDGARLAYFVPGQTTLSAGPPGALQPYELDGVVTGVGWVTRGDLLYVLVWHPEGLSTLTRVNVETGAVQPIRERLDAPPRFNALAVSLDSRTVYLALASDALPAPADRHRPEADRDTDIYALDLASGRLRAVVEEPGDDFYPVIANGFLYWTHNDFTDEIVAVPADGGEARAVASGAQIPYFSSDGKQLAYTIGGWRIADWALNLDAAAVSVDDSARATAPPRPIVTGYHEDFTPAWSPDGRWLAYHSHRSRLPVPGYASAGSTDDIYLRRADAPMDTEIRLTDWGWEVGMADWSPDGRRLVFDSWDREGPAGVARPWIVTVDTATGRLVDQRRLALPRGVGGTLLASWSPAGDEIALVARETRDRQALWVVSVDGRSSRRVAELANTTYGGLDWTPDGGSLVYAALADGRLQLFRVARTGGAAIQLTRDRADLLHPQVSPDGRWVAATRMVHQKVLRRRKL